MATMHCVKHRIAIVYRVKLKHSVHNAIEFNTKVLYEVMNGVMTDHME